MRHVAFLGIAVLTMGLSMGCERAAYMEPREAPEYGVEREFGYERQPYYRSPGYQPFYGEREFGEFGD